MIVLLREVSTRLRIQVLINSIKRKVKKKHFSRGWNVSTFAAHLIEKDLFWPSAPVARVLSFAAQRFSSLVQ
jgi:hypothetical protein